jgi:hypothetical protein
VWGLGNRFRTLGSGGLATYTVPGVPKMVGKKAVLQLDKKRAAPLLDYFAGRAPSVAAAAPAGGAAGAAPAPSTPTTLTPPVPTKAPPGAVPDPSQRCA